MHLFDHEYTRTRHGWSNRMSTLDSTCRRQWMQQRRRSNVVFIFIIQVMATRVRTNSEHDDHNSGISTLQRLNSSQSRLNRWLSIAKCHRPRTGTAYKKYLRLALARHALQNAFAIDENGTHAHMTLMWSLFRPPAHGKPTSSSSSESSAPLSVSSTSPWALDSSRTVSCRRRHKYPGVLGD